MVKTYMQSNKSIIIKFALLISCLSGMVLWIVSLIYGDSPNVIAWIVCSVSMLIIIFSMDDAILFKSIYKNFRSNIRKITMIFIGIVVFALIMSFLIPYTLNTYPVIFIIGFVSLWFTLLIIGLISFIFMFIVHVKMKERHPEIFLERKMLLASGFKGSQEYGKRIREVTAKDPVLYRMSKMHLKIILYGLLIWLTFLLIVIVITIQENSFLNKYNAEALAGIP